MSLSARRLLVLASALLAPLLALAAPGAATVSAVASTTFTGAFEFEGLASESTGGVCHGQGAFGVMKVGARVLLSERVASGDFQKLGKGKVGKGKVTDSSGDKVCHMPFKVKAPSAPASDSRVYLEVKGVTFNISWPASDVADGDLGTWRCEFSDNTCAELVGG